MGPPTDVQQMDTSPDSSGKPAIGKVPDLSGVSLDDNVPATSLDYSSVVPDITAPNNAVA